MDQLPLGLVGDSGLRGRLLARWRELTREVLPAMAAARGWRLRHDHCFQRVCLDAACGRRWDLCVPPPAVRRMDDAALARAVAVAERIAADPSALPALDAASRRMRR